MHLHSVSAYADTIIDELDADSQQVLRSIQIAKLSVLHSTWGQAIRNEFGLWDAEHPLTTHWHKHPEERDIQNGIDDSLDHPDHVSTLIMEAVWKKVNA